MKQYNVALKAEVDYNGFLEDMEFDTYSDKLCIPNHKVE
jgi:hypothetical protein